MTLRQWIIKNRPWIDGVIRRKCSNIGRINDRERRLWALNDIDIYTYARCDGVRMES